MKKSIILFVLAIACISAFAQKKEKKTLEQRTTEFCAFMVEKAGISEEQKTKVYNLRLKQLQDQQATHQKYAKDKEKSKPEMKEISKTFHAELKKILTVEQYKKYTEARKAERKEPKGKGKEKENKAKSEFPDDDE